MYTLPGCVYCEMARRRLRRKSVAFSEQPVERLAHRRETLMERTGGWTAPQIVIGARPIGGADALARLDRAGVLDELLAGARFPRAVVRRRLAPGRALRWMLRTPSGRAGGPWAVRVEVLDEDGRRLERRPAPTLEAAVRVASELNAG